MPFALIQQTADPDFPNLILHETAAAPIYSSNIQIPPTVLGSAKPRLVNAFTRLLSLRVSSVADVPLNWLEPASAIFQEIDIKRGKEGLVLTPDDELYVEFLRQTLYLCYMYIGNFEWAWYLQTRSPNNI